MIANFFNKTKPINFLVLSFLLFLVYTISTIYFFSGEISIAYFIKKGFYLFLAVLMLFIFDFIIRKNTLTNDNSFALYFYILFYSFFPLSFENTDILIANFFLLLAFRKIYSLRTPFNTREKIFDSAFCICIASMFYDWSFLYLILLYASIFLFHKNSRKNTFIPIVGFFTPIFLLYIYLLATDKLYIFGNFWQLEYSLSFGNYLQKSYLYPIIFITIFTIFTIFPTTKKSFFSKQDFKSTWAVLMFQIVLSLIVALISLIKNGSELNFLFIPLSILFANYLQDVEKRWLKEIILYLFIIVYLIIYLI
ncbi:MAG: DUF6427 family protein [Flavobacteriaceae bacterium]|nr:DUF6427 family protein [Flavobacteriaceae bacterium]